MIAEIVSTLIALAFVLALAWAAAWLVRRTQFGTTGAQPSLRLLRSCPVGPRERVVLVDWEGTVFLLGVTAGSISILDKRPVGEREAISSSGDAPDPDVAADVAGRLRPLPLDFREALRRLRDRRPPQRLA